MYNLIKRYNEPHRYYHNFTHIASMFETSKMFNLQLSNEQLLAIYFHDIVYYPNRSDNELQSANVFQDWAFSNKANDFSSKIVRQIILDTKEELPTIEESKLVIDLDLYILTSNHYWGIIKQIEKEYLTVYTKEQYDKGRKEWLENFLKRDKIYVSEWGSQFETTARYNMKDELSSL